MFIIVYVTEDGSSIICEIFEKHYDKMLYKARRMVGEAHAEDVVQDAFAKLIEKFGKNNYADLSDKPVLYFVIMVRNLSINILKKEGRIEFMPIDDEDVFISPLDSPEETLLNSEALDRLTYLIGQLKPAARQLIDYRYVSGYSNTEIAKELGVSKEVVADRMYKVKKLLKEMLEKEKAKAHE